MDGEWEFYSGLLSNEISPTVNEDEINYINVPKIWNNYEINGENIGGTTYGTYRLKLILPKEEVFLFKDFQCCHCP